MWLYVQVGPPSTRVSHFSLNMAERSQNVCRGDKRMESSAG